MKQTGETKNEEDDDDEGEEEDRRQGYGRWKRMGKVKPWPRNTNF